jgi:general secretion pathway protein L
MPADRDFAASASARMRTLGRRTGATGFGQWWAAELAALVPSATRSAVKRRRMRTVVAFADDAATVWQPSPRGGDTGMERVARVPAGDDPAGRAAVEAIVKATGSSSVVIALPAQQVLRRTLALPDAVEENLRQTLAYDLDRHTPFRPEDLYFDAVIVGRDAAHGTLQVDLATVRRAVVDKALAAVESWGGRVVAVVPDAPETAAGARLNLLPDERRTVRRGLRWAFWIPLVLVLATAVVALVLPIWQKREQAIALGRQVDEARGQAAVSEALRRDLDRLVGTYNFALERKFGYPPAVQVLDEVTKLLPDDTWLTQLEFKAVVRGKEAQRELLLRGESGNAGRLITLFEESKVFTQAAPRSPTTKIQPGPGEIFDLVAQLHPLPRPAPIALGAEGSESAKPDAGGESAKPVEAAPDSRTTPAAPSATPSAPPGASAIAPSAPGSAPPAASAAATSVPTPKPAAASANNTPVPTPKPAAASTNNTPVPTPKPAAASANNTPAPAPKPEAAVKP